MDYQVVEKGYAIWRNEIMIPTKSKPGEKKGFFRKEVALEEAPTYWEYVKEGEQWNLYYIKRGVSRRLAVANMGEFPPMSVLIQIQEREITVADCNRVEEYQREKHCAKGPKVISTNNWSVEFDNKSILALLVVKPKMTYQEVLSVITNEGGYVDSEGIIHKGAAENKIREV